MTLPKCNLSFVNFEPNHFARWGPSSATNADSKTQSWSSLSNSGMEHSTLAVAPRWDEVLGWISVDRVRTTRHWKSDHFADWHLGNESSNSKVYCELVDGTLVGKSKYAIEHP